MEKTYRFCSLRKWKDFNNKQLTLRKTCVTSPLRGPWADLWRFYSKKSARKPHRKEETHNLSKVSRFLFKSFYICRLQKQLFFLRYNSLYFERILNFLEQEKEKNARFLKRIMSFLFSCSFSSHSCLSSSNSRPCFHTTKLELPELSGCNVYASLLRGACVMSRWHSRIERGKKTLRRFLEGNVAYFSVILIVNWHDWWISYYNRNVK